MLQGHQSLRHGERRAIESRGERRALARLFAAATTTYGGDG